MHPAVREAVSYELARAFQEVQSRREVVIGPELQIFINGVVSESLEVRGSEWEKNLGLDPDNADHASKIASRVSDTVEQLIRESDTYASFERQRRILLIGFLQLAHKNWCGIFPFCR